MPSKKNVESVEGLKEILSRNPVVIGTGHTGLGVAAITELRRGLRQRGLEYRVVKNTLAGIAADELGRPEIREVLQGPTGLVLGDGDPAEIAKTLTELLRASRIALTVQGAVVEGKAISSQDVTTLSTMPPKPEMVATLLGQLVGVMARLVTSLNASGQGLATVLNGPSRGLATVLQRSTER